MLDVLILGCGYLGRRAAKRWIAGGKTVAALTRSRTDELIALGIAPILGDVMDPASLEKLPRAHTVLHAVGFDRSAGHSQRDVYVTGLQNVIAALPPPQRFLHVSSTGVYGQTDGEWVDETSPTEPVETSGQVFLDAEGILKQFMPQAIILRFAGIYGPGRMLRQKAILAGEPLIGDADKYLNLIHVEDGVTAILAAESLGTPAVTYCIADDAPPRRRAFYEETARLLNAPAARFESAPSTAREANRRVSNRKARKELNFVPVWSTFVTGLAAALADRGS